MHHKRNGLAKSQQIITDQGLCRLFCTASNAIAGKISAAADLLFTAELSPAAIFHGGFSTAVNFSAAAVYFGG